MEEVLPIYSQVKNDKDQGGYADFLECLKQYDKQEDGKMVGAELKHILLAIGKRISREQNSRIRQYRQYYHAQKGCILTLLRICV